MGSRVQRSVDRTRSSPRIGQPNLSRLDVVAFKVDRQTAIRVNLAFSREVFPQLLAISVILDPAAKEVLEQAAAQISIPFVAPHVAVGIGQYAEPRGCPLRKPEVAALFLESEFF